MQQYNSLAGEKNLFKELTGQESDLSHFAMLLREDGTVEMVPLTSPEQFLYTNIKSIMGLTELDMLEQVEPIILSMTADVRMTAYVDENGLANKRAYNPCASTFCAQQIVGPMLILNHELVNRMDELNYPETPPSEGDLDAMAEEHEWRLSSCGS